MTREAKILKLQDWVSRQDTISIPRLQREFFLSYRHASALLRWMIGRSWLCPHPRGVEYPMCPEHLAYRRIRREETEALFEMIDDCCSEILVFLKDSPRSTARQIYQAVEEDEADAVAESVGTLLEHRLIHRIGNTYSLCVSDSTADILRYVYRAKRRYGRLSGVSGSRKQEIMQLFDPLFSDGGDV